MAGGIRGLLTILLLLVLEQLCVNGVHFVSIGDWGSDTADQQMVAQAMSDWCGLNGPCDFIASNGDNFYPQGVTEANSTRFNTTWKWVYDLPNIDTLVWYNAIGNRDYGEDRLDEREENQKAYALTDPQWNMPNFYYDFVKTGPDGVTVHFFVVDTTSIITNENAPTNQFDWLDVVLGNSSADWKVMYGHTPGYTSGDHAPGDTVIRNTLVPYCNTYLVDLFVSGHDHNLQHITEPDPFQATNFIISGGGGRDLYAYDPYGEDILTYMGMTLNYFGEMFGFVDFQFTRLAYTARFVNASDLSVPYNFTRNRLG